MLFEGVLKKMKSELGEEVQYYLEMFDEVIHVNQLLDRQITLKFKRHHCLGCEKDIRLFRQGFCYKCFYSSPLAGEWIIRPELSKAHLNIEDRDLDFEKENQLQPHIVYLANTGDVKVGITRKTQVPARWIDQGAHEALPVLEVPNRYLSGVAEIALKERLSDRTNWRNMLRNQIKEIDLNTIREEVKDLIPEEVQPYFLQNEEVVQINFPVLRYPEKVKSFNFKKGTEISGKLKGIKGQYFIFEDDTVLNIRGNSGYVVELRIQ